MPDYDQFRVLLDEPASSPVLRFEDYGRALAEIVTRSEPRFAVGIFGKWGTGKTTLMRAIECALQARPDVIPVDFNAWRYEREEHLIVPLLDNLREELERWSEQHEGPPAAGPDGKPALGTALRAARAMASAGRAIFAGVKLSAGVPLLGDLSFDGGKVLEAWNRQVGDDGPQAALSYYHSAFRTLHEAVSPFLAGGMRRLVVFIDDLDRCLPSNALEVLESMKLFFDEPGFVFVVGLDLEVIQQAIEIRYGGRRDDGEGTSAHISGTDYAKKIFQVPFPLPIVPRDLLHEYFDAIVETLEGDQRLHFETSVSPHLDFLSGEAQVNPREVKRLLNAYILQLKMLGARFAQEGRHLEPDVVLALQIMAFRSDWRRVYDAAVQDPTLFVSELQDALARGEESTESVWTGSPRVPVPRTLLRYLRGVAQPLLREDLESYVTAMEATRSSDPELLEIQRVLRGLQDAAARVEQSGAPPDSETAANMGGDLELLRSKLEGRSQETARALAQDAARLDQLLRDALGRDVKTYSADWCKPFAEILTGMDADLVQLRRRAAVGAESAA